MAHDDPSSPFRVRFFSVPEHHFPTSWMVVWEEKSFNKSFISNVNEIFDKDSNKNSKPFFKFARNPQ